MATSFKSFLSMLLLSVVLVQIASAAPPPGRMPSLDELRNAFRPLEDVTLRTCPNEYLVLYSKCKGELQECANCLGVAERSCRDADKKKGGNGSICSDCTSSRGSKCSGISDMCYGDQECKPGFECVNYVCIDPKAFK